MSTTKLHIATLKDWHAALVRRHTCVQRQRFDALNRIECVLEQHPHRIELGRYVGLTEHIGQQCGPSSLAWSAGLRAEVPTLAHDFRQAVFGMRKLGCALKWAADHFALVQDASRLRLRVEGEHSELGYKIVDPRIWPRHEDAMYVLGFYAKLIRTAAPDAWSHAVVKVEAARSDLPVDLSSITGTRIVYSNSDNAIRFPSNLLAQTLQLAPPCPPGVVKHLAANLVRQDRALPMSERTRLAILACLEEGPLDQDRIASELCVSSRTLRRRLSQENQSFQSLLDECRLELARRVFEQHAHLPLSEVALALGFSEHSTFSRAFSRWCGMSPQAFKMRFSQAA